MAVFSDYKPEGPLALPGKYELKLLAGGKSLTSTLELKLDPRVSVSEADLQKQLELAMKVRNSVNDAADTVNQIHDLQAQLKDLERRLAGDSKAGNVVTAAKELGKELTAVEEELIEPKIKASEDSLNYPIRLRYKLVALGEVVESADAAPTGQSYELFKDLRGQLDAQLAKWREITAKDVPALNEVMKKQGIAAIMVVPVRKEEEM
jgi:hypothetical protein